MSLRIINRFEEYLNKKNLSKNTIDSYKSDIQKVNKLSVKKILENFTTNNDDVKNYLFLLKKQGYSTQTILRNLSSINMFNKFLFEEKFINYQIKIELPFDKNVEENEELVVFTRQEVAQILDFDTKSLFDLRDKAIFELVYAIGLKPSDCINLNKSDCNLEIGYLKYKKTDGVNHTIPLNIETSSALSAYLKKLEDLGIVREKLFLSSKKEALSRQGFWKIFKKRQLALGLKKELSPTTFRNSLAIHLLEDGVSAKDVKDLLGLRSINSLRVYFDKIHSSAGITRILNNHPRNKIR